jgi:hypothetical protein
MEGGQTTVISTTSFGRDSVRLFLHVVVPLGIGGFVYLSWRTESLLMFSWAETAGVSAIADGIRTAMAPLTLGVPYIVRWVLPDALWAYAFAAAMRLLWQTSTSRLGALCWTALGPALAVVAEIGQRYSLVPGVFDPLDLVACALALPLVLVLVRTEGAPQC